MLSAWALVHALIFSCKECVHTKEAQPRRCFPGPQATHPFGKDPQPRIFLPAGGSPLNL